MTDPISILSACDIAAKVATKTTKLVRDLAHAPDKLLALSNELWNIKLVLDGVREARQDASTCSFEKPTALDALLYQARIKLDDANATVSHMGKLSQWGDCFTVGRSERFLWLKQRKRVAKMQAEIIELRTNLTLAIGSGVASSVARIEVDVRKLAEDCIRTYDSNQERAVEGRKLSDTFEQSAAKLAQIHESQAKARDVLMSMLDMMKKLDVDREVDRRFDDYIQPVQKPSTGEKGPLRLPNTPLATANEVSNDPVFSTVISGRVRAVRVCPPDCPCRCHAGTVYNTPQLLQNAIGRLFLGYTGTPAARQNCLPSCRQRDNEGFQMTYFFPKWFLQRAVSLSMMSGLLGSPSLNLKIRRLVPEMSHLFALSRYGDVEGLRSLFMKRLASPDDVHIRGGWTALHFAVDHGCVEAYASGTTPVEIAWRNILHLRAPPQVSDTFSSLFPGSEYLQERQFTKLHRLAIELEHGDIETELKSDPDAVHAVDIDGWTPLHWAARRGNYNAVIRLLDHGADPQLPTANESRNALHLAAQGNSPSCVERLLQYRKGNKMLDIDGKDGYGNSAIRISAGYNCAAATAKLIKLGADLNACDRFGEPGLFSAVYENAHETITQMLKAGADYTMTTTFGNTILHFAANEADTETLPLLTKARLVSVDTEAKNSEGKTATALAEQRDRAPTGFLALFERLVASVGDVGDHEWEMQSNMTMSSAGESWKSFEESIWYEADLAADEDVRDKEALLSSVEVAISSLSVELEEEEGVTVEDKALGRLPPEEMV